MRRPDTETRVFRLVKNDIPSDANSVEESNPIRANRWGSRGFSLAGFKMKEQNTSEF